MKKIRNKAAFALLLLFLSNVTYSSEEKNNLDEVTLYFTLSQCSEYVIGTQYPNRTLDENITTYLDYLRVDKKDIYPLSQEIIRLKDTLPKLDLILFKDNANRDEEVSFCAIASAHYIEQLKNKLEIIK
ncbi:hypothetical protein PO864_20740 (plasmid) [Providencia alcalifaciens]|uniref:hypothetical protein n=1 Tax=Providencia alcalifaciens TaxID=126385 RepID=UPI00249E0B4C|nr:hypothetical protein [Providencia alcalifaciens]WGZ56484.1 hypothetical protein PO864_20740 [Providencia alcalifaciens]